jgi:site-specific recombinase XerD
LIRRARCSPPPPRALSEPDQRRLLAVLQKAKRPEAERDHALFHVMLATGIRIGSAVALDVEDVFLDKSEILLRKTKGDRPDVALLGDGIRRHLRRYMAKQQTGPLFTGRDGQRVSVRHVQRRLAQWLEKAGITQPASAHSLRHAFAMRVYQQSGDVLVVKELLRHRSITSTMAYTRVDTERLRRAL